jgi:hypothetical protein
MGAGHSSTVRLKRNHKRKIGALPTMITPEEIVAWSSDYSRKVDLKKDIPLLIKNEPIDQFFYALKYYLNYLLAKCEQQHEDLERDCVQCLTKVGGPYRGFLPSAYTLDSGEDISIEELEAGEAEVSFSALQNYLFNQNSVDEKERKLFIWRWLEALKKGPACDFSELDTPPANLEEDFKDIISAKALAVFASLAA